jgi:hypothetical protein
MGFLLDNILQQQTAMREMNKTPTRLLCDPVSFDVLMDELKPFLSLTYPTDPLLPTRIYGLIVELSPTPNFEVV